LRQSTLHLLENCQIIQAQAPDAPHFRPSPRGLGAAMAPAGDGDAPQDVQNGPAAPAAQQQQQQQQEPAKPVKRYRRAELDEEENNLLLEDGEDE